MRHLLLALAGTSLSFSAYAEERACCRDESNWYVGVSGMAVLPKTVDLEENQPIFPGRYYDLETGVGFSGLMGYQFVPNASIELEVIAQESNEGDTNIPASASSTGKGTQRNIAVMLNHRWIYRNMGSIAPYVGAGVGVMNMQGAMRYDITVSSVTESHKLDDMVLAYQFMAGVNFAVPNTKFEFFGGYRYIGTSEGEVKYAIIPGYAKKFDGDSHNIEIGVRMHF